MTHICHVPLQLSWPYFSCPLLLTSLIPRFSVVFSTSSHELSPAFSQFPSTPSYILSSPVLSSTLMSHHLLSRLFLPSHVLSPAVSSHIAHPLLKYPLVSFPLPALIAITSPLILLSSYSHSGLREREKLDSDTWMQTCSASPKTAQLGG